MVNYGIMEFGFLLLLIALLAYFSLNLPMLLCAAIGGLGLLVILVGFILKKPADKKRKKTKK